MKTWTLLASTAALLFLAGFSLLGAAALPTRPRATTVLAPAATSGETGAARRYRQSAPTHWRDVVLAR
jgi:hypothetical protein